MEGGEVVFMNSQRIWVYFKIELLQLLTIYISHMGCFSSYHPICIRAYLSQLYTHLIKWFLEFDVEHFGNSRWLFGSTLYLHFFRKVLSKLGRTLWITILSYLFNLAKPPKFNFFGNIVILDSSLQMEFFFLWNFHPICAQGVALRPKKFHNFWLHG